MDACSISQHFTRACSEIYKSSARKMESDWLGYPVQFIQNVPQMMQKNKIFAGSVIFAINMIFFSIVNPCIDYLNYRIERHPEELTQDERIFKHIFLNTLLVYSTLALNDFSSLFTQYSLSHTAVVIIGVTVIAARFLKENKQQIMAELEGWEKKDKGPSPQQNLLPRQNPQPLHPEPSQSPASPLPATTEPIKNSEDLLETIPSITISNNPPVTSSKPVDVLPVDLSYEQFDITYAMKKNPANEKNLLLATAQFTDAFACKNWIATNSLTAPFDKLLCMIVNSDNSQCSLSVNPEFMGAGTTIKAILEEAASKGLLTKK